MTLDSLLSRRELIQRLACGVGGLGLTALLAEQGLASADRSSAPGPHHTPKARSLIFLNMMGGPTQFETFDYKPEMHRWAGRTPPVSERQEGTVRYIPGSTIIPPLFRYLRSGRSGVATTEIFPRMAEVLDELCVIRSMVGDTPAHPSGQQQAMTGYARQPMPSLGSWITYGLGSANRDLPAFVYLAESPHHGSGFLPATSQGMPVGARMPNLRRPTTINEAQQRDQLDLLADLNRDFASRNPSEDPLAARIEAGELAFRMQMSCPDAVDLSSETSATMRLYGLSSGGAMPARAAGRSLSYTAEDFATKCLIARRLVERGVRVVTICVGGRRGWDQHGNLRSSVEHNASVIDTGMAALIRDLRTRGLLDSTIVMWGGEFGRTPYAQGIDGRDHFARGFTYWLAGGGARRGIYYGETDETGMNITKDPVHFNDLHATVLHLMGLDPERLTYRYAGREQRLTNVHGRVVNGLLA